MRVLHINSNYITSKLHQTMIEHLDVLGIESEVFVGTYDKNRSIVDIHDNVTVSECFKKWDRLFFDHKQNKIIKTIESTFDMPTFDIIHAYTLFTDGNTAMELSKTYGIPFVVAVRNTDINSFFKKMVHLRKRGIEILSKAQAIFFLSSAYMGLVLDKYIPSELRETLLNKTYIIPNGIDDFWLNNSCEKDEQTIARLQNKKVNCLFVGTLNKNKNTGLIIKAIEILRSEGWDVSLTAIGKAIDNNVYEQLQRCDFAKYLQPMPKEQLINYYRSADVFVMPSHKETFGLVYAEAMSQGLPVIYTRGQGFDKQFAEGEVGFAVSDDDAKDVSEAIKKILENYSNTSKRATRGVMKFLWNDLCRKYISVYKKIVGEYGNEIFNYRSGI